MAPSYEYSGVSETDEKKHTFNFLHQRVQKNQASQVSIPGARRELHERHVIVDSHEKFQGVKPSSLTGFHVFYLPSVEHWLKLGEEVEGYSSPEGMELLRECIAKNFYIPSWFWQRQGWDANGFFGSTENPMRDHAEVESSHCSYSRFLVKEVEYDNDKTVMDLKTVPGEKKGYHWRYVAFSTLWFRQKTDKSTTLILLCFDLFENPEKPLGSIHKLFRRSLSELNPSELGNVLECPYDVYLPLVNILVGQYDRALWTFREPWRDVEKNNEPGGGISAARAKAKEKKALKEEKASTSINEIEEDNSNRLKDYRYYHELSRHIIHASETLNVAVRTISDIVRDSSYCSRTCCATKDGRPTARKNINFTGPMEAYGSFVRNLEQRADAFYKRMQNEINLAYHFVDADDYSNTKRIMEDARHDGRALTKVLSLLSVLFLPPTVTCAFFGMNFPFGFESLKPLGWWVGFTALLWIIAFFAVFVARELAKDNSNGATTHRVMSILLDILSPQKADARKQPNASTKPDASNAPAVGSTRIHTSQRKANTARSEV